MSGARSLWRYESLLPVSATFGSQLAIGQTPLYHAGSIDEVDLFFKDDTRNPSGSLKDRASEVTLAAARELGAREVIVASTGNAAASTACIGASMRLSVSIIVPRAIPRAKLAQARAYGAKVYRVNGDYDDAYELSKNVTAAHGIYNRNTGFNPLTREGKKTCAFEIVEQLGWRAPDWVLVPTGDGNILSGLWKGFRELHTSGVISTLPRLVAAQAQSSNAIALALRARRAGKTSGGIGAVSPSTIADSISVRRARDLSAAVTALEQSDGMAQELFDAQIAAAVKVLAARWALFVEPASAAAFAAFQCLSSQGTIRAGEVVVCVLTGSGLKDCRLFLGASATRCLEAHEWKDWPPRRRRVS